MGSVIDIVYVLLSPAGLGDAGNLAVVGHVTEAKPAETEAAIDRSRAAAPSASRVRAHLVLGLPPSLDL